MEYNQRPQVMMVNPANNAVDIPTTTKQILVGFNTDLDTNFISGMFVLTDGSGQNVALTASYSNRMVTLTLQPSLLPGMLYKLEVLGDVNIQDEQPSGIRNVFGTCMAGIYTSIFTTAGSVSLPAPVVLSPADQVVLKENPSFVIQPVSGAVSYQFELSRSNTMIPVIWPISSDPNQASSPPITNISAPVVPDIYLEDSAYYWHVRALASDGTQGEWSPIYTFALDTVIEGVVAPEDPPQPESFMNLGYDPYSQPIDIPSPFDKDTNISPNLETIYIVLPGTFTEDQIQVSLTGENVLGDGMNFPQFQVGYVSFGAGTQDTYISGIPTIVDHGNVGGTMTVTPQADGTTLVAFTLPALPAV